MAEPLLELSMGYNKSEKNRPGVESYLQLNLICFSETIHDFMNEPIRADLATEFHKNFHLFNSGKFIIFCQGIIDLVHTKIFQKN